MSVDNRRYEELKWRNELYKTCTYEEHNMKQALLHKAQKNVGELELEMDIFEKTTFTYPGRVNKIFNWPTGI